MTEGKKSKNLKTLKMGKELYHTFKKDERMAEVYKTSKGFEVELYEQNNWSATRKVHQHSESYAEKVFNLEPEDKGYYGYREKSDNFHPDLD